MSRVLSTPFGNSKKCSLNFFKSKAFHSAAAFSFEKLQICMVQPYLCSVSFSLATEPRDMYMSHFWKLSKCSFINCLEISSNSAQNKPKTTMKFKGTQKSCKYFLNLVNYICILSQQTSLERLTPCLHFLFKKLICLKIFNFLFIYCYKTA